jgi:hypothetical protein
MKNTFVTEIEVPKSKRKSATAILKRMEALIAIAEPEDLERLERALEPKIVTAAEKELAKKIAGKDYVEGRSLELELANLERYYQRRRELLEGSITSSKVVELLGCQNRATVRDRRLANTLLGIKDGGVYKYPLWQFDPEGDDGVIDGLPEVLSALDVSDFIKLNWFNKPHLAFSGQTPIEILKQGKVKTLVREAMAVGIGW